MLGSGSTEEEEKHGLGINSGSSSRSMLHVGAGINELSLELMEEIDRWTSNCPRQWTSGQQLLELLGNT